MSSAATIWPRPYGMRLSAALLSVAICSSCALPAFGETDAVSGIRLGTTVATNALLEGKGATVAYVTTRGFKDVPFIGRGNRRHHYDLAWVKPKPFVQRRHAFEVDERIGPSGEVETYYRGLGRPQGIAFDVEGNLYVAASLSGKRGIVKITPSGEASLAVAGAGLVGLAFAPGRSLVLATNGAVHHLAGNIQGLPLADFSA